MSYTSHETPANQTNTDSDFIDPDPISIILEIVNLVFQPGSLALIAAFTGSAGAVASAVIAQESLSHQKRVDIRRNLYNVDRALTEGYANLTKLASIFTEHEYLDKPMLVGGAPIKGYTNGQLLRRMHEDLRAAVKDSRDAFMDLSAVLPANSHAESASRVLHYLNEFSNPLLGFGKPYGMFFIAATFALTEVDRLVCDIGEKYEIDRSPREFTEELVRAYPTLRQYR